MPKLAVTLLCAFIFAAGCSQPDHPDRQLNQTNTTADMNPAADGFKADSSDAKAMAIADSVMIAMGGRKNWDQTKIIQWTFFGKRTHTWNKQTGRDSIRIPDQNMSIDMNINSHDGTVMRDGEKITQSDSVQKYLKQGYAWWVNDSYWLIMPYKLKDSGVTLKYKGIEQTEAGASSYKLQLTFDSVGVTPDNKFYVYVDTSDNMVRQWTYFPKADMDKPGFVLPWKDYKKHGKIMLSGNRGKYTLSDIEVMDHWPGRETQ